MYIKKGEDMKPSGIGGQAVIEGVMMRNGSRYAVAVRTADQQIVVDTQECGGRLAGKKFVKLPIIRGVVNFFDSLVLGMKTLMFSASLFAEETEEERQEREDKERRKARKKADRLRSQGKEEEAARILEKCEKKLIQESEKLEAEARKEAEKKDNDFLMTLTVIFSLIISVALFMMLPYFISRGIRQVISSEVLIVILEGLVRLGVFLLYMGLISRMKDIQRTFMYHGAEHKCINCIEHGLPLTVENVRASSREHKRCGTSFLFIVMFISIVFIMVFSIPLFMVIHVNTAFWRIVLRIALLPVIAGVSYEFIRLAGSSDSKFVNLLSRPGMALQHLTTKEPDDSMIEVAIASVEAVFDWKKFQNEQFGMNYDLAPDSSSEESSHGQEVSQNTAATAAP